MKKLFLILILFISFSAQANAPIADIQSVLDKSSIICGQFDQTKQLVGISKPLYSNGRFCVVSDKGVLWQTVKPFPSTLKLTREDITQTQGGETVMRMDSSQEPVVKMINSILFSLLAGDFSELNKMFTLDGNIKNKSWQVVLNARDPGLAKVIGNISLDGNMHVKHVVINETNGDKTTIVFSAIKTGNDAMTVEQKALFK